MQGVALSQVALVIAACAARFESASCLSPAFVVRRRVTKIGNLQSCFGLKAYAAAGSTDVSFTTRPMLLLDEKSPDSSSSSSEPQLTDSAAENLRLQDQLRAEADMHRLEEESAALRSEIAQLQSSNQSADDKMGRLRQVLQEIGRAQQELDKVGRRPKSNA